MTSGLQSPQSTPSSFRQMFRPPKRTKYFDLSESITGYSLEMGYDENGKRYYVTPEGNKYSSVTTILSTLNAEAIENWKKSVGEARAEEIRKLASARGTNIHKVAERYLLNEDNYDENIMPFNRVMFDQIRPYLDQHCDKVYANEIALYSDKLKTAGRCDLIARVHNVRTIVDFKTSKKFKKEDHILSYFYQATAYALMLHERTKIWCPQICLLIATEEDDLQVFLKQTNSYVHRVEDFFDYYHESNRQNVC